MRGQADAKRALRLLAERGSGVALLYGPPGTGKTLLGKAFAEYTGRVFKYVSCSDVMRSLVGQSEQAVRTLFEDAEKNGGYVFADECDAMCPARTGAAGSDTRVTAELLVRIERPDVLVVLATNAPWNVDAAVRSRVDYQIYVPLPTASEIAETLRASCAFEIPDDVVESSVGLSGRDVAKALKNSKDGALWRRIEGDPNAEPTLADLEEALAGKKAHTVDVAPYDEYAARVA